MGERKRVRIVPYEERKPLYAAYAAAHKEAERIGGTLSDDSIVQAGVKAYEKALLEVGRLLPPGGEVRTEWSVVFEDGFRAKTFKRSMARAYRAWLDDPSIATVGSVEERTVTTWPDGTQLLGPWSPVVSDTSDERPQWTIRDHTGTYGVSTTVERVIRRSWAQGITWWDPEGSYELCRREGPDAPWEVVERHPAVPDNSAGQEGLPASTDGVAPPAGDEINK